MIRLWALTARRVRGREFAVALLGLALHVSAIRAGEGSFGEVAVPAAEVVAGDGVWRDAAAAPGAAVSLTLSARRTAGGEILGEVTVEGSPLFQRANVDARLSGRGVVGKLLDDEGKTLVEFSGAVSKGGASGTYRDSTGGSGEWSWQGDAGTVSGEVAAP